MTIMKGKTPNGQRNRQILKSVTEKRSPVPTRQQVAKFRSLTPEQVYADFPIKKR